MRHTKRNLTVEESTDTQEEWVGTLDQVFPAVYQSVRLDQSSHLVITHSYIQTLSAHLHSCSRVGLPGDLELHTNPGDNLAGQFTDHLV